MKFAPALLRPYALCGHGRLSVICPSKVEMITNLAILEFSSSETKDWNRTSGPMVLMVKSVWIVSAVTVRMGCSPELTPTLLACTLLLVDRLELTCICDHDIHLSVFVLDYLSGSNIILSISRGDLDKLYDFRLLSDEAGERVVNLKIDVSYSSENDIAGVGSQLCNDC